MWKKEGWLMIEVLLIMVMVTTIVMVFYQIMENHVHIVETFE